MQIAAGVRGSCAASLSLPACNRRRGRILPYAARVRVTPGRPPSSLPAEHDADTVARWARRIAAGLSACPVNGRDRTLLPLMRAHPAALGEVAEPSQQAAPRARGGQGRARAAAGDPVVRAAESCFSTRPVPAAALGAGSCAAWLHNSAGPAPPAVSRGPGHTRLRCVARHPAPARMRCATGRCSSDRHRAAPRLGMHRRYRNSQERRASRIPCVLAVAAAPTTERGARTAPRCAPRARPPAPMKA